MQLSSPASVWTASVGRLGVLDDDDAPPGTQGVYHGLALVAAVTDGCPLTPTNLGDGSPQSTSPPLDDLTSKYSHGA
jgi:hypothetical protein